MRILTIALFFAACVLMAVGQRSNDSGLLETGRSTKPEKLGHAAKQFSIVTYNIRWRTGDELTKIADWLKEKRPTLIALQEVDRSKERTKKTNNARALAEQLGMYYAWAAPPLPNKSKETEEETGVELLSPYPLTDVTRIVLPHAGPGGRWRVALGATVKIEKSEVRVYSVHSETRIPIDQKIDQFRAVLNDLKHFPSTPAVVMGDFNSWEPATVKKVRQLFTAEGFVTPFSDKDETFKRNAILFDVTLKLDWVWLRGLKATSSGIDRSIEVSDHYPLWLNAVSESPTVREGSLSKRTLTIFDVALPHGRAFGHFHLVRADRHVVRCQRISGRAL
jgi:endonuclease/exonuclease/phosphatase family metal-dependent hydrolase